MAILEILTAPHPVLAAPARDVTDDEFGASLAQLLSDMAETMYAAPGVGLAAPQIGDGRRILVMDSADRDNRGKDRLFRMVNPKIVERSQETITWSETCLSVPDLEVDVQRTKRIRVQWRDEAGNVQETSFEDYEAVIFQHEHDHLMGTVLLDRVSSFRRSRYMKKLKKAQREFEASAR
jgi:peptide deformylase